MSIKLTYTPNFNRARAHYAASRMEEDGVPMAEAFAEWDRFVSRVRSETLREATSAVIWDRDIEILRELADNLEEGSGR